MACFSKAKLKRCAFQGPGDADAPDAMKQAGHPWHARHQPGHPRAVIQVSPPSHRDVVVQRHESATLRAAKTGIASMAKNKHDGLGFRVQIHTLDCPRPFQAKQFDEKVDVTHGRNSPLLLPPVHYTRPTANPEEPKSDYTGTGKGGVAGYEKDPRSGVRGKTAGDIAKFVRIRPPTPQSFGWWRGRPNSHEFGYRTWSSKSIREFHSPLLPTTQEPNNMPTLPLILAFTLLAQTPPALTNPCRNGSFEELSPQGFPVDWMPLGEVTFSRDAHSGQRSLRLVRTHEPPAVETGVNARPMDRLKGGMDFHYKALAARDATLHIYAIPIGIKGIEDTNSPRAGFAVPKEHVGDGRWHHARLRYDFSKNPLVQSVIFAARLEGHAGELLLDDISYVEHVGPLLRSARSTSRKTLNDPRAVSASRPGRKQGRWSGRRCPHPARSAGRAEGPAPGPGPGNVRPRGPCPGSLDCERCPNQDLGHPHDGDLRTGVR